VRQLVSEQKSAAHGLRLIEWVGEDNVASDGESGSVDGLRCEVCPLPSMDPHRTEIMTKARLHETSRCGIQRLAGRAQNFTDAGWDLGKIVAER
jgi:hypothetical protein